MLFKHKIVLLAILLLLPTLEVSAESRLAALDGWQKMEDRMPAELIKPSVADSVPTDLKYPYTIRNISSGNNLDYHPEFSPDGTHIVFISRTDVSEKLKQGEFWHKTPFYLNLWIMNSDGSSKRQLTVGDVQDFAPKFSSDGKRVFFVSNRNNSMLWDIWSIRTDGMDLDRLTNMEYRTHYPVPSPDGKEMAFIIYKKSHGSIWLMDMDKKDIRRVTSGGFGDDFPLISPDGKEIVFKSTRQGNGDIWTIDKSGKNYKRLTYEDHPEFDPAWSPDGTKISYVTNKDGIFDVWVMDRDGSNKKKLTKYLSRGAWGSRFNYNDLIEIGYYHVSWNPDGKSMALTTWDPEKTDRAYISILDFGKNITDIVDEMPNESEPIPQYTLLGEKELTKGKWNDFAPCFSPDGKTLIFASNKNSNWDIWSIGIENEEIRQLTKGITDELAPVFSPDGKEIAYLKQKKLKAESSKLKAVAGSYDIWIMKNDGTSARQITNEIPVISYPAWNPESQELAFIVKGNNGPEVWSYEFKTKKSKKISSTWDIEKSNTLLSSFSEEATRELTDSEVGKLKKLFPTIKEDAAVISPFIQGETENISYPLPGFLYRVDYSTDGETITFESNRSGNVDIWTMKRDGSGMKRLTKSDGPHINPVFSPDGKKIAYSRQKLNTKSYNEKNYNIWIADVDSGEEMMINGEEQTDWNPAWSPDGKKIAYVTNRSGEFEHFSIWMLYLK